MGRYEGLTEMLHAELDRIQERGELSAASLAQADTIAHTLKDIATFEAMEESGHSERYPTYYRGGVYDDGGSYGPGRGRGSSAARDHMGRYSSEYRNGSYDDGGSYRYR